MDSRVFRSQLGTFATGVCVITATDDKGDAFGMTINSFCSVSLEPPLVMWSIGHSSECFSDFSNTDQYTVNILREDQKDLSKRYSTKGDHGLKDGDWQVGESGCPVLSQCLTRFECDIETRIEAGDHTILIGRVLSSASVSEGDPLVFFGGRYASLEAACTES